MEKNKDGFFADGIGAMYEFNGVVRMELLSLNRKADGGPEQAEMKVFAEIRMPLSAFLQAADGIQDFARELEKKLARKDTQDARRPHAEVSRDN